MVGISRLSTRLRCSAGLAADRRGWSASRPRHRCAARTSPGHPTELGDDGAVFEPGAGGARQAREGTICTTSRYIPVDRSEPRCGRAGIPEYSRAAAWRPADAHPIRSAGTDLPARAFTCRTRNPTGLVPGGFPRIRDATVRTPGRATDSAAPSRSGLRTRRPSQPADALPGPLR